MKLSRTVASVIRALVCKVVADDLTGHLCKQPQFRFNIKSYLVAV